MVDVAQLVEHQIVALVAVGSNPTIHPKYFRQYYCLNLKYQLVYIQNLIGAWRNW